MAQPQPKPHLRLVEDDEHVEEEEVQKPSGLNLGSLQVTYAWVVAFAVIGALVAVPLTYETWGVPRALFAGFALGGLSGLMVFCGRILGDDW